MGDRRDTEQPTAQQRDQSVIAQTEIFELLERLIGEGFDYRVVLSGAVSAVTAVLTRRVGLHHASAFFARASSSAAQAFGASLEQRS